MAASSSIRQQMLDKGALVMRQYEAIQKFEGRHDFLSNFFCQAFLYKKLEFRTAEHAFQWEKATTLEEQDTIREAETPGKAKRFGAHCKLRSDWELVKRKLMKDILLCKFKLEGGLGERLLDTGLSHLEEGNLHGDRIWGTVDGQGQNLLGLTLMEIRRMLRCQRIARRAMRVSDLGQIHLDRFAELMLAPEIDDPVRQLMVELANHNEGWRRQL